MREESIINGVEMFILSKLEKLSPISFYTRTRGWHFILSWGHRITGMLLVFFVWFHIYALPSLYGSRISEIFFLSLLEWILTIPVMFHAFNGGRLILYESFGRRDDQSMTRWVFGLSILYMAILGILMLMGDQSVSPFLFWFMAFPTALIAGYGIGARIWRTRHAVFWKIQRISGAFLIIMAPAYILFMHLNPLLSEKTGMIAGGIQDFFIRMVHLGLLVGALYHGGYGVWSLGRDYLSSRGLRTGLTFLVILVSLIFLWLGIRVVLDI